VKCSHGKCPRVGVHQGLCNPHRDLLVAAGVVGQTCGDSALAHLRELEALNWPSTAVEQQSGVARATLRAINAGRPILRATERSILAVPLVPYLSPRLMLPAVGMRRRHEALGWMGWTMKLSATHSGHSLGSFSAMLSRGTVSRRFWLDYSVAYADLKDQVGPNELIQSLARRWGWAPPFAWDEDTIDDPAAEPNYIGFDETVVQSLVRGEFVKGSPEDKIEATFRLAQRGLDEYEIARALRSLPNVIRERLGRAA
jgi:hypothetical protein